MKNSKFTIIELLIVVAIIGILLTILLPSLSRSREKAKRAVCASNLKQTGYAALTYANNHNGGLPDWTLPNNYGSPNETRAVGSTRNLKHGSSGYELDKTMGLGKLLKYGYLDLGAAYKNFYCPSRVEKKRYAIDTPQFGWHRWKANSTVEYSYQHRYAYLIHTLSNKFTFGADIAIWDNDTDLVNKSFGTKFGHGSSLIKDQFYNVQKMDLSVLPLYDKTNQLDNPLNPLFFYNRCDRVLDKMQQMLP